MKFLGSYVYIITNKRIGTLYTGVTSDLIGRISKHKNGTNEGFSKEHSLTKLVWFEVHDDINEAILREKRIKKWNRKWKLRLIEEKNPFWQDLFEELI